MATPHDGRVRVCDDCRILAPALIAGASVENGSAAALASEVPSNQSVVYDPPSAPLTSTVGGTTSNAQSQVIPDQPTELPGNGDDATTAAPTLRSVKEFDIVPCGGGLGVLDDRRRLGRPKGALFNLPSHERAEAVFRSLCNVADAHLAWVVKAAVEASFPSREAPSSAASGLRTLRVEQWANTITKLARKAVSAVDPNVRAGDRADVRVYIKIKAIPSSFESEGGRNEPPGTMPLRVGTCEVINGVFFRRSLAHKQMRQDIPYPRVMLLNGAC